LNIGESRPRPAVSITAIPVGDDSDTDDADEGASQGGEDEEGDFQDAFVNSVESENLDGDDVVPDNAVVVQPDIKVRAIVFSPL
jgi:hypothetical protein